MFASTLKDPALIRLLILASSSHFHNEGTPKGPGGRVFNNCKRVLFIFLFLFLFFPRLRQPVTMPVAVHRSVPVCQKSSESSGQMMRCCNAIRPKFFVRLILPSSGQTVVHQPSDGLVTIAKMMTYRFFFSPNF